MASSGHEMFLLLWTWGLLSELLAGEWRQKMKLELLQIVCEIYRHRLSDLHKLKELASLIATLLAQTT